ncbi:MULTISPECIES: LysR family transcriptional regulator [Aeromonas]|jgi:DNA-binding transcriptional LysR family regulator|uniref:LysR family transcriptional regulator n=1 Tax=Aeromonas veronii TaxID=654 RepID=A0A2T4N5Q0_AERVE|nr:LysR family transcriptional regulator [Aeromonas veronii]MBA2797415.1 LysR family transcriptional regulator [Aeromonas veronii]MCX0442200.1 LysR family transcriptional regulator [Aeromonas veronii]PTH82124.1 LysR family transcriptional regulator [Aeromonas veronii]RDE64004.1 LysR family transcriptional regulator [Aeromonas veronii]UJP34992.1 LysR family transcriptional regulator [Aeromonas veronii]
MRTGMELNALKIFIAVVENSSFVGASKTLQIPTSNVSRSISQLEEALNLQLIERSTRHMKLTQSGQLLYTRVKPLLESLEQTEAELTSQQIQLKGPLRICIPNEAGPKLLGTAIADFACQHPEITISCITNLSGLESLREDLDMAIIIHRGKMDDCDYIASHLATIPCTVVGSPSLIQKWGLPNHTSQLKTLPCITTVSALKGMPWQFTRTNSEFSTIQVNEHYRVNSGELALKAAIAGVGFAILAKVSCQEFIDDGSLVEIELDLPAAPLQLFAVYANRQYLPAKTRVFLEFIRQNIMSYQ